MDIALIIMAAGDSRRFCDSSKNTESATHRNIPATKKQWLRINAHTPLWLHVTQTFSIKIAQMLKDFPHINLCKVIITSSQSDYMYMQKLMPSCIYVSPCDGDLDFRDSSAMAQNDESAVMSGLKKTSLESKKSVMLSGSETSFQNLDSKDSSTASQNDYVKIQNDRVKTQKQSIPAFIAKGGSTRYESLQNALEFAKECDYVIVSDCARCNIDDNVMLNLLRHLATGKYECVVPFMPVRDSVIYVDDSMQFLDSSDRRDSSATPQNDESAVMLNLKKTSLESKKNVMLSDSETSLRNQEFKDSSPDTQNGVEKQNQTTRDSLPLAQNDGINTQNKNDYVKTKNDKNTIIPNERETSLQNQDSKDSSTASQNDNITTQNYNVTIQNDIKTQNQTSQTTFDSKNINNKPPTTNSQSLTKKPLLKSIKRENLKLIQTPQISKTSALLHTRELGQDFSDESSAMLALGCEICFVEGSAKMGKLTTREDLHLIDYISDDNEILIGHGSDIHAFEEGKLMRLCGVEIESSFGFKAHSDGDVGIHAVIDSILGAMNYGDIGEIFPDTNMTYSNIDSRKLLKRIYDYCLSTGLVLVNLDVTIIAQTPRISPYKSRMQESLAEILYLSKSQVSIKASTAEKLGFIGRKEGVLAQSLAQLKRRKF